MTRGRTQTQSTESAESAQVAWAVASVAPRLVRSECFRRLRQMRSELRQVSALPVAQLRSRADAVAQELRELDNRIQQANWSNDLEEESGSR